MSTENATPKTDAEKLELAKVAIAKALKRVREDENIRYHMGAFTETFECLKEAHMAFHDVTDDTVEEYCFGTELKYKPHAKVIEQIKSVMDDSTIRDPQRIEQINAILGR
jgi:hypothetical protein